MKYVERVGQIAELLRLSGRDESEVQAFVNRALARRDRRMFAYFTRRYLGFWKSAFGAELRDDIVERTEMLYHRLAERMYSARDEANGWRVLAMPRGMQMTVYHSIPFKARGYQPCSVRLSQHLVRLFVLPSMDALDEAFGLVRMLYGDRRSADLARYLLAIADEQGFFTLKPRYYDAFGWDKRYAQRYAHFAVSRFRREGYVVLVKAGRLREPSQNRLVAPQLLRFALDVHDAIARALGELDRLNNKQEDEDDDQREREDRREAEPAVALA